MSKVLFLLCAALVAASGGAVAMTLDEALALFQNDQVMVEYSDAGKAQLLEIIATFKAALNVPADLDETDAKHGEEDVGALQIPVEMKSVVNKLSQAYYTLGNVFTPIEKEGYPIFRAGKHWGFKSLRMNPQFNDRAGGRFDESVARETDIAALYWTNANWLRASKEDKLGAVAAGVMPKTEAISNRILELDPNYLVGGAWRSFGGYYSELPLLLRNLDKALKNLCHVVDEPTFCSSCGIAPSVPDANAYFENRTFFVQYYLMPEKKWEDAIRVLQSVLSDPIGTTYTLMNAYSQENAKTLLAECQKHL